MAMKCQYKSMYIFLSRAPRWTFCRHGAVDGQEDGSYRDFGSYRDLCTFQCQKTSHLVISTED